VMKNQRALIDVVEEQELISLSSLVTQMV